MSARADRHSISDEESKRPLSTDVEKLLASLPDPDVGKSQEEKTAIDRKLVRKLDIQLVPWLSLLYLLSFLDRTNIGNARLAGMEEGLGMHGTDYNMTLTVFFIAYAVCEPLTNALLKRLTPRIFFTAIILTWGTIMTLTGLCTNYAGLLVARFFLGAAEAGLFPGVNFYLSCWYTGHEIGLRSAMFFSAAALAGSFGGLLAAAIALMDGVAGLAGWAWIFILEGLATVLAGAFCWWMVYDWPDTAGFLTPDERIRVQRRIILSKQNNTAEGFDKRHIYEAIKDWKTYGYMVIYMGCLTPLYAFSLFLPTIVAGMGYNGTMAQLLTVPPYACGAVVTVIAGFFSDYTMMRGWTNISTTAIGALGFVMLLATENPKVQYAGTFLGAVGIYPSVSNTLSWATNNTEGALKRAFAHGMIAGWGNLNGVVSSNIYITSQKPRYWTGHAVVLSYQVLFLLGGSLFMHFGLKRENNKRRTGKRDNMLEGLTEEEKLIKGDNRPDFLYTL
ncbi:major facilitator superfamily transporter [Pseudomassariella vexata]|uniref:Major facilitator superfamily transporter n=1 Tax=Pseudomassariella vexata TaxID=1141098 RepID=A0A1Y2DKF8_9PEZI|nr:major facilitator superfamily transporter [Pseudomassariella vexata]ORY59712.1 major facilitator superfamily transporter [Pseudomassariella vexata]